MKWLKKKKKHISPFGIHNKSLIFYESTTMIMVMLPVATMTAKVMQMAMIEVMVAAMTPGWGARMNCGRSLSLSLSLSLFLLILEKVFVVLE